MTAPAHAVPRLEPTAPVLSPAHPHPPEAMMAGFRTVFAVSAALALALAAMLTSLVARPRQTPPVPRAAPT